MKHIRFTTNALLITVLVTLLLTSCSPAALQLGIESNGKQIELKTDQVLEISLPANITTGFNWEVSQGNGALLAIQGDPVYNEAQTDLIGAGGTAVFTFKALEAGSLVLEMIYRQPWDDETPPADTFTLNLTIK